MSTAFQTSRPPLRSKFSQCYTALLSGRQPWIEDSNDPSGSSSSASDRSARPDLARAKSTGKSNSGPRMRWFADLLCLPVETQLVVELLGAVSADTLLDDDPASQGGLIRENVGSLWREAIRVWRQDDEDEVRRKNAVDTLVALSYPILAKRFSNYAFDVIAIFAGGMDEADDVFISLVDAIDDALRSHRPRRTALASSIHDEAMLHDNGDAANGAVTHPGAYLDRELQHRALQLGLLWLSSVSQTSLGAYFLRRDLFVTVTAFIQTPSTSVFAFESSLFLGLLATVGQGSSAGLALGSSTSNPYARRMRDWVDNACMHKILVAAAAALERGTEQYVEVADDTVPSLAGSIAGMASLKWISGLGEMVGMSSSTSSASIASDANGGARRPSATGAPDFSHLPPPATVILLPVFLLCRSNQAFAAETVRIVHASADADSRLPYVQLLSLSSYLCSHAASTPRSRSYARIALLLLLVLLHDPTGMRNVLEDSDEAAKMVEQVRICRQREPALAYPRHKRRRLVTTNLDVATCYIRFNLSKRLDVPSYLLSLKVVQRCISLCAIERIALEYDWADTWSSILSLASFLAGRHGEMRISTDAAQQLVKAVVATLNTALLRSDHFLASTRETQALVYELMRSSHVLRNLVRTLDPSLPTVPREGTPASSGTSSGPGSTNGADTAAAPLTPTPAKIYTQLPGFRNIERVILAVEAQMAEWVAAKPASRRNKTPDIGTISKMVASLDLEALLAGATDEDDGFATPSSASSGGAAAAARRSNADLEWLDRMQESSLSEFVRWSCADVTNILPIY